MGTERIGVDATNGFSAAQLRASVRPSGGPQRDAEPAQATRVAESSETTVTISPRAQQLAAQAAQDSSQADEQAASEQSSQRSAELRRSYNLQA